MTARQQQFFEEYLVDLSAAAAARRAGYSTKTADRIGSRLLRNPEISAAIADAKAARAERTQVTADRIIAELAEIAFSDIRDFIAWDGSTVLLKASSNLASAAAVAQVRGDGETVAVRLHDKLRALELLGRHLGLFSEHIAIPEGPVHVTLVWPEQAEQGTQ